MNVSPSSASRTSSPSPKYFFSSATSSSAAACTSAAFTSEKPSMGNRMALVFSVILPRSDCRHVQRRVRISWPQAYTASPASGASSSVEPKGINVSPS